MERGFRFFAIIILPTFALAACGDEAPQSQQYLSMQGTTGCLIEQITTEPFDEYQFQGISPDGEWLSYAWSNGEDAAGNPVRGAYLMNLVTGEHVQMTDPINNSGSFSPDGRYLVGAQYTAAGTTEIYELDLETGHATAIAPDPQWDWLPTYSPDGRLIAFVSYRINGQANLYLYDHQTGDLRHLISYDGYDAHPEFSPDGSRILFHRMNGRLPNGGFDFDLATYDLVTGDITRLTRTPFEESYASWAPDGQHIVFSSDSAENPGQHNLYVLGSDGQVLVQLTDGNWADTYAYWTRDGKYIYFNSNRAGNTDVYRMPMNGLNCMLAG